MTVANRIVLLIEDGAETEDLAAVAVVGAGDFSTLLLASAAKVWLFDVAMGFFSSLLALGTGLLCVGTA